ncbi:MAG: penicillin acylase family protein [Chloroflexi bacterium]|nr:penicillin acylase family protein [Chloroflexota bacterium]
MTATSSPTERARSAIPALDGTLALPGLDGPVQVVRDHLGIPHIKATTTHDAFFAQGFVHAQDRLWHMEYDRARALGRWAAYVGPGGLDSDKLTRRLGLAASAQADYAVLNAETRAMLDAYSAGVNAFISTTIALPIELQLLGVQPEPWQPWHCGAVFKVRHALMGSMAAKLWRLRIAKTLGPDWITKLRAGSGERAPLVVPPGLTYYDVPDGYGESVSLTALALGLGDVDGGSNNWTVHGSRTASGKPLLAGDPHRAIDVPNVYYQHHIAGPEFDAIGYAFVGVPGITHFGHNQHVAWGVTTATSDQQDLYVEKFAPGDPARYQYQGEWRRADRRTETIEVRGEAPVEIDITTTHHGPVIVGDPASGTALAARALAVIEPNRSFESILPMLRATSVAELEEAKRPWVDPDNNFVMADTSGNIGYLTRGQVPVRSAANHWLPVPGWTGEHEWQGIIPFEEMPRARNPEQGFIATANQRIVGTDYPHHISNDWSPPHRAMRVNARLREMPAATIAEMAAVHADKVSIPSAAFVDLARRLEPADASSAAARDRLLTWDGDMLPDGVAPTIYAVWREQITQAILAGPDFRPLVDASRKWDPLPTQVMPPAQRLRNVFFGLLLQGDTSVLPPGDTWETLGARALAATVAQLTERLGADQDGWRWQEIHRTRLRHPLSGVFPQYADLLDPPSVGVGGDGDTPQNGTHACSDGVDFTVTVSSVTRYAFDLADWDNSGWTSPIGGTGHPASPHYADQVAAWSEQRLNPMLYTWASIEADAESRQTLEPA